jgi:four helix bundle protein
MEEKYLKNTHKNLIVYQKSVDLSVSINEYFSSKKMSKVQEFITLQLIRATCSIGANIAEGYGRLYKQNYRQFLSIARGSSFEVDYWLEILAKNKWFEKAKVENFIRENIEIIKMLSKMVKTLET